MKLTNHIEKKTNNPNDLHLNLAILARAEPTTQTLFSEPSTLENFCVAWQGTRRDSQITPCASRNVPSYVKVLVWKVSVTNQKGRCAKM